MSSVSERIKTTEIERDAFSPARHLLKWRRGELRRLKLAYRRRLRRGQAQSLKQDQAND